MHTIAKLYSIIKDSELFIDRSYSSTLICLFIVKKKRIMKYMTKIGQKTGMLKASKNVQNKAIRIALVEPYLKK